MIWEWFKRMITRTPLLYIGGRVNPYMIRWDLIPKNEKMNVFLHKFQRDDDDRALHDHPWGFVSIVIWGSYIEWTRPGWHPDYQMDLVRARRRMGSIVYRPATARHMVSLDKNADGSSRPCWTIVITGSKSREWGFWCWPNGFVPWQKFVDPLDEGGTGKGCGD